MISGLYKRPFPGLGLGFGIFAAYVVVDNILHAGEGGGHHAAPAPVFEKVTVGEMPTIVEGGGGHGEHH